MALNTTQKQQSENTIRQYSSQELHTILFCLLQSLGSDAQAILGYSEEIFHQKKKTWPVVARLHEQSKQSNFQIELLGELTNLVGVDPNQRQGMHIESIFSSPGGVIGIGWMADASDPSPSVPCRLRPQQYARPATSRAHVLPYGAPRESPIRSAGRPITVPATG